MKGIFTILNYYFSPGRRAAQWPLATAPAAVGDRNLQPEYMIPVRFKRVESFIQTANGKLDRKRVLECEEIKTSDGLPEESTLSELSAVPQKAFAVIKSTLAPTNEAVTLETSLGKAGVDSITFVTLVVALEGEFNFEWDDEMLLITAFSTIRSMVEYVESRVSE